MVVLTLTPHRGNGARSFPYTGYLGLSPVTLAGVVRTKVEEDRKTLDAAQVLVRVRCYETTGGGSSSSSSSTSVAEGGGGGAPPASCALESPSTSDSGYSSATATGTAAASTPSAATFSSPSASSSSSGSTTGKGRVLYEKTIRVWSAETELEKQRQQARRRHHHLRSDSAASGSSVTDGDAEHAYPPRSRGVQYAELGDLQKPWRIVIPPEAVVQGAKSTMIFKTWRVWWAVEAVIFHRPAGIHGDRMVKSHQIALLSYAPPDPSAPCLQWTSSDTATPSPLDYTISGPPASLGSSDPFAFSIAMRKRKQLHSSETPKRISIELRREIAYGQLTLPLPPASAPPRASAQSLASKRSHAGFAISTPRVPAQSHRRAVSSSEPPVQPPLSAETGRRTKHPSPPLCIPSPAAYDEAPAAGSYFAFAGSDASAAASARPGTAVPPSRTQTPTVAGPGAGAITGGVAGALAGPPKIEDVSLATFETDLSFDRYDACASMLKGSMPRAKSLYHYALGESCATSAAYSRFYFVIRFHYKQRSNVVELMHRIIAFTTISAEERDKATEQLPKVLAVQAAEAKLFGQAARSDSALPSPASPHRTRQQTSSRTRGSDVEMTGPDGRYRGASPMRTDERRASPSSAPAQARLRVDRGLAGSSSSSSEGETEEERVRLSTVRRRSEQPDGELLDLPRPRTRNRVRYGAEADSKLSPIMPSPNPSVASSQATVTRPRSRRTYAGSIASGRSVGSGGRPRSAGGLSVASSGASVRSIPTSLKPSSSRHHFRTPSSEFAFNIPISAQVSPQSPAGAVPASQKSTDTTTELEYLRASAPSSFPVAHMDVCPPQESPIAQSVAQQSQPQQQASAQPRTVPAPAPSRRADYEPWASPSQLSPMLPASSSPSLAAGGHGAAGLFANFEGFTLRPPTRDAAAVHRQADDEDVAPKPGVARGPRRSSRATHPHSHTTGTRENLQPHKPERAFSYEPPILLAMQSTDADPAADKDPRIAHIHQGPPLSPYSSRSTEASFCSAASSPAAAALAPGPAPPYAAHISGGIGPSPIAAHGHYATGVSTPEVVRGTTKTIGLGDANALVSPGANPHPSAKMARTPSAASTTSLLEASPPPNAMRRKSGTLSLGFSFFRRSSKA